MRPDEMLTAITFPATVRGDERGMFIKPRLGGRLISVVNTAVIFLRFWTDWVTQASITLAASRRGTIINTPDCRGLPGFR